MSVTVLVVDDASFVRDLVKRAVRKLLPQANILEAPNGTRAQALMRQRPVDLILSDWEMPETSGEELLRWVRQNSASAATPFVMITSRGDRDHVVQAIQAGVNDYLTKPFTADELTRKLLKQFKRMGLRMESTSVPNGSSSPFDTVSVLTRKAGEAEAGAQPSNASAGFLGRASIRFTGSSTTCQVRDISLHALVGSIEREALPALFESAAVDLESEDGQTVVRINAYVHLLQGADLQPDTDRVKVVLRFVDKDPAKLDLLSKFLTQ